MKKGGFFQRLLQRTEAPQPSTPAPGPSGKVENYQLTGVEDHLSAVMAMAKPNPDYKKPVAVLQREGCILQTVFENKWDQREAELAPEPDDPKTIKVLVAGAVIGQVKAGSCAHIHKLLQAERIERVTCQFGGGEGKMLVPDEDSVREAYNLEKAGTVVWAKVSLQLKAEN